MAVAVIMDFEGGTLDQYDQVIERMGLQDGISPDNAHFHWVAQTEDGLRVVDVWETREAFDAFAQEQIGPFSAEAGLAEPALTYYDVHNTIKAA